MLSFLLTFLTPIFNKYKMSYFRRQDSVLYCNCFRDQTMSLVSQTRSTTGASGIIDTKFQVLQQWQFKIRLLRCSFPVFPFPASKQAGPVCGHLLTNSNQKLIHLKNQNNETTTTKNSRPKIFAQFFLDRLFHWAYSLAFQILNLYNCYLYCCKTINWKTELILQLLDKFDSFLLSL